MGTLLRTDNKDYSFDLMEYVLKLLKVKWFFLIFVLIGFGLTYFMLRSSKTTFFIQSSVLLEKNAKENHFIPEVNVPISEYSIIDEAGLIISTPILGSVIDSLNLQVKLIKNSPYGKPIINNQKAPIRINLLEKIREKLRFEVTPFENHYEIAIMDVFGDLQTSKLKYEEPIYVSDHLISVSRNGKLPEINNTLQVTIEEKGLVEQNLRNKIKYEIEKGSRIVRLSLTDTNSEGGVDILNVLMDKYLRWGALQHQIRLKTTNAFINQELLSVEQKLDSVSDVLERIRKNKGIYDLSIQGADIYKSLKESERRLTSLVNRNKYYEYILLSFEKVEDGILKGPSTSGIDDQMLSTLIVDYNKINSRIFSKSTNATEINPQQRLLKQERSNILNLIKEHVGGLIDINMSRIEDTQITINELSSKLSMLPDDESQLVDIKRNFDVNEAMYLSLLERQTEVGISMANEYSNVKIVDAAFIKRKTEVFEIVYYGAALIISGLLGILIIIFNELFGKKIVRPGQISDFIQIDETFRIPFTKQNVYADLGALIPEAVLSIWRLRTKLIPEVEKKSGFILSITSDKPGAGKSFMSEYLAKAFVESGLKTIVLQYGENPRIEISKTTSEVFNAGGHIDVRLMDANALPLNLKSVTRELEAIKKSYDIVIIDMMAIGEFPEHYDLLRLSDQSLFVIRHDHTRKASLSILSDYITDLNDKFIILYNGLNLNDTLDNYYFKSGK
ncbi:MAG: hypothetical protein JXQ90_11595 [Cyclobacteriaceae bacterium]